MIEFEHVFFTYEPEPQGRRKGRNSRKGTQATDSSNAPEVRWALAEISLRIHDGELFGIAGHTGSGKSTLIQMTNGLLQPTRGNVRVDGRDLADKTAAFEARRTVGVVFQYPERQLFAATVAEDIAFGPCNLGLSTEEADGRVREAMRLVHLDPDELGPRNPFSLSGGQQRRVALAGVLAMQPGTLVLDEPFAGLDPKARRSLLDLIVELHHERGLTIVLVSHSMDDLARLCDRILVLNGGRIHAIGAPAEVFADEDGMHAIGLGMPQATSFANRLLRQSVELALPERVPTIEELADAIAESYQRRQEHI